MRIRDRIAARAFVSEGRFGAGIWEATGCEIEVFPYKDRWEWAVYRKHKSCGRWMRGMGCWSEGGSWRRPAPDQVNGRCKNQGDAWAAARAVVDQERQAIAARENVEMQRHSVSVPLYPPIVPSRGAGLHGERGVAQHHGAALLP